MPIATAPTPAAPSTPIIKPNVELRFPTKAQADAFIDGINYVGDDRVTVLGKTVMPTGRTTVHLLDERQ